MRPGDVLQFQDVLTPSGPIVMHTAIVVANLGFNTCRGGTVWVYRPVAK